MSFEDDYAAFVALVNNNGAKFRRGSKVEIGTAWFRNRRYNICDVIYGFEYAYSNQLAYRVNSDNTRTAHTSVQLLNIVQTMMKQDKSLTAEQAIVDAFNTQETSPSIDTYKAVLNNSNKLEYTKLR